MKRLVTTLAIFALAAGSRADFVLVDDMEGGDFTSNWTTNGIGTAAFVSDPDGGGNTVLASSGVPVQAPAVQQDAYRSIPTISAGTVATIFMRVRSSADGGGAANWVFGTSDNAAPTAGWGEYEGYGRISATTAADFTMDVRNTGAPGSFSAVGDAGADTWYNVWLVLDNTAAAGGGQVTDFYFNTGALDATDGGTLSFADANFRRGDENDLVSLYVRNNRPGTTGYIDDVYIDLSGENLINPIPEPSTLALIGLGASAMLMTRRLRV